MTSPAARVAAGPGDRNPGLDGVRDAAIPFVLLRHALVVGQFQTASVLNGYCSAAAKASWWAST